MDVLLIISGIICLLTGLAGCIIPVLPGPSLSYAALLLLHFTDKVQFSLTQLLIWLIIVVIVQIIDYFVPSWGAKKMGGTRWGIWGCFLGTIIGVIFFAPLGIILGPFSGAVIGELLGGKKTSTALRAGIGAFLGFMAGVVVKFAVCGWFIYEFFHALI